MNDTIVEAEVVPGTEIAHQPDHRPMTARSVHPGTMIDRLMENPQSIDIAQMKGLFELQKEYDDELARKAYNAAKAKFSAMAPTIIRDGQAKFEGRTSGNTTEYQFATLAGTMDQIREALQKCKLNVSWKTGETEDKLLSVTCYLTHALGHQEETTLSASRDAGKGSTGMNSLQAVKSTTTYLQRITLYALLGLASRDDDDDGVSAVAPEIEYITQNDALKIHAKITDNGLDMEAFMRWLAVSPAHAATIEDIPVEHYTGVMRKIDATIKAQQS